MTVQYQYLTTPARTVVSVTKDDDNDLPGGICKAINVGSSGTLNFICADGTTVSGYPAGGGYHPIQIKRVLTGGTADNIFALY